MFCLDAIYSEESILGKGSAFVWRIEYQKEVFHMLISSFRLISILKTLIPLMQ
jgi:hypothetical protein